MYNWRSVAYRAFHYHVKLEDEDGKQIDAFKFNTYDEAKHWIISAFMQHCDMRTHTLDITIVTALGNTKEEFNWKECKWWEEWWTKILTIRKG